MIGVPISWGLQTEGSWPPCKLIGLKPVPESAHFFPASLGARSRARREFPSPSSQAILVLRRWTRAPPPLPVPPIRARVGRGGRGSSNHNSTKAVLPLPLASKGIKHFVFLIFFSLSVSSSQSPLTGSSPFRLVVKTTRSLLKPFGSGQFRRPRCLGN